MQFKDPGLTAQSLALGLESLENLGSLFAIKPIIPSFKLNNTISEARSLDLTR